MHVSPVVDAVRGTAHVELGMYPFESVQWAWDELWAAVHARAPWTPSTLTRSGDVHSRWYDPTCVVTHVCGWPFAALHRHDMHLLGAFALDLAEADDDAHYRSVLLSPADRPLSELVTPATRAVANSADSLSGWLSLLAATVGAGGTWPGEVTFTAAHYDSLVTLARGEGDLACIDSWTLALIERQDPDLVGGLFRVGLGPRIPTPALAARSTTSHDEVADLRRAVVETCRDPSLGDALDELRIAGFVELDLDAYLATLSLGPGDPIRA